MGHGDCGSDVSAIHAKSPSTARVSYEHNTEIMSGKDEDLVLSPAQGGSPTAGFQMWLSLNFAY